MSTTGLWIVTGIEGLLILGMGVFTYFGLGGITRIVTKTGAELTAQVTSVTTKLPIMIEEAIKNVRVKTSGRNMPIESLSGGNQQKVVLGRMLLTDPKILLLDEPTRGIDVGAKGEIFDLLRERAEKGLAVLFVTSEISEAMNWSDRIVVMSRGHIVGIYKPADVTREEIMSAAEATKEEGARV